VLCRHSIDSVTPLLDGKGQGIALEFDESLVDHLAEVGYQPEYGARELRRQVRSLVETKLANALLKGDLSPTGTGCASSTIEEADEVRWEKPREEAAGPPPRARGAQPQPAAH
jgi:ATP-dependent Clp protease ATP-binding subunit ClpC